MSPRARRYIAYVFAFAAGGAICATAALALGTADDAKAMLNKTVAALKADKAKTLDEINKGENGFLVGDIYVFCFNLSDGKIVATAPDKPNMGVDIRTNKDATGDAFGQRIYDAAKEGQVNEASLATSSPSPGPTRHPCQR
jgi:hypothetical protein